MDTRVIDDISYDVFTEEDLVHFLLKRKKKLSSIFSSGDDKIDEPVLFDRILFVSNFFISDLNFTEFEFRYCIFEKEMVLCRLEINRLLLVGCQFHKNVSIEDCTVSEIVQIRDGKFYMQFEVDLGNYKNFEIVQDAASLNIWRGTFEDLHIHSNFLVNERLINVDKIFLRLSQIKGRVFLEELNCQEFFMKGNIESNAEISIKSINFNIFAVENLFNSGKLRLFDLGPLMSDNSSSLVHMTNSNFGKAEFFDCDFSRTASVIMKNCFFIDTLFVKVIWPDRLQMKEGKNDPLNLLDLKENYRQLKYSYSKQGDSVLEHKFHALEMDTYRTYLRKKRKTKNGIGWLRQWKFHRQTSIILWFSSWSSDYGQSFKRPLYTLLGTGLLLFPVMVYFGFIKALMPGYNLNFTWPGISATIGHYLNFINPLRRYDTMDINAGLLLDFVMRIIASYCIYNFIRATRRFVK